MPIKIVSGEPVLLCINHDDLRHGETTFMQNGTTMRTKESCYVLVKTHPPDPGLPARLDLTRGQVCRMFVCALCGYVEIYHAPTVQPEVWKAI